MEITYELNFIMFKDASIFLLVFVGRGDVLASGNLFKGKVYFERED